MRPSVLRVGPKPSAWYPESRVRGHRDAWVGWPRGMEADTGAMQTREVMQTQGWCRHGGDADTGVTQTRKVIQTLGWCRHGRWYRHRGDADMRGDTDTGVMQTREVIQTLGWCRQERWCRHRGDADTRGDTDTGVMQTREVIQTLGWCRHERWYRHCSNADMGWCSCRQGAPAASKSWTRQRRTFPGASGECSPVHTLIQTSGLQN